MKKRLSYSSVYLFTGCSKKWEAQYIGIDGVQYRDPPNVWTARGTAVHAGLEKYMLTKVEAKTKGSPLATLQEMQEAAASSFRQEAQHPEFGWVGRGEEQTLEEVNSMLEASYHNLCPTIDPNIVEWELEVPIPGTDGWTFLARMDLIGDDSRGAGQWIYDWKTGKPWTEAKAGLSQQFTAYGWAFHQFAGEYPTGYSILSITPPSRSNPSVCEEVITKREESQYRHFEQVLQGVVKQIEAGAYWPNHQFEWCHRCPLGPTCTPWKAG
jgi:hypothetical protein